MSKILLNKIDLIMKKLIICVALFLFISSVVEAQNRLRIDWSSSKDATLYSQARYIGSQPDKGILFIDRNAQIFGSGKNDAMFLDFNKRNRLKSNEISEDEEKKKDIYGKMLLFGKDGIKLINAKRKGGKEVVITERELGERRLRPSGSEKELTGLKINRKRDFIVMGSAQSPDRKYHAVIGLSYNNFNVRDYLNIYPVINLIFLPWRRGKKWYEHPAKVILFDENLKRIYEKTFTVGESPYVEGFKGIQVNNNGDVMVKTELQKVKTINSGIFPDRYFNDSDIKKVYIFNREEKLDVQINFLEETPNLGHIGVYMGDEKLYLVGNEYESGKQKRWLNIIYQRYDLKGNLETSKILPLKYADFEELNSRQKRRLKERKQEGKGVKKPGLYVQYIKPINENNLMVSMEKIDLFKVITSPYSSAGSSNQFTRTDIGYDFGNALVSSITKEGKLNWKRSFEKTQHIEVNSSFPYGSYYSGIT